MKKALAMIIGGLFTLPLVTAYDPRFNIIGNWLYRILTPDEIMLRVLVAILLFIIYFLAARLIPLFKDEGDKITKGPRVIFSLVLAILSVWAIPTRWVSISMGMPDWLYPLALFIISGILLYLSYGNSSSSGGWSGTVKNSFSGMDDNNPFVQLYRAVLYLLLTASIFSLSDTIIFGHNLASQDSLPGLLLFFIAFGLLLVSIYKVINFIGLAIGRGGKSSGSFGFGFPSFSGGSPEAKERRKQRKKRRRLRKKAKQLLRLLRRNQGTLALHQKKINANRNSLINAIKNVSKK